MAKLYRDPRFRIVKDGIGFVLGWPGGAPKPDTTRTQAEERAPEIAAQAAALRELRG